eukprot:evm.model.scf_128EXC.1 EVM.evm.TU.scf_128EXC.1   scf_128EXC:12966-15565(+)
MESCVFGDNVPGFEIGPKDAPAVVVIQEWWGVTDIIKGHAEKISSLGGYRCLVPDLYKGKIGVDKEEASHMMGSLDFEAAIGELKQAVDYLRAGGSPTVGAVGFCMGGALTFCAAQHAGVDCAAPFYGTPARAVCQPEAIKVPVQAHFGKLDEQKGFSDTETAMKLEAQMKEAGVPVEFFYYEGAGHAFLNEGPEADRLKDYMGFAHGPQSARDEAWSRLMAFFATHLKKAA